VDMLVETILRICYSRLLWICYSGDYVVDMLVETILRICYSGDYVVDMLHWRLCCRYVTMETMLWIC
jgi:hypothetical protein